MRMSKARQAPGPSARQQEKSAQMRRRICEGAVSCLSARGYHGTSIKQVVDAAGVSLGAWLLLTQGVFSWMLGGWSSL